jgi:hypothetical protein
VASNPHLRSWRRRLANRARTDGLWRAVLGAVIPVVALAAAGPLVEPVFMAFLAEGRIAEGSVALGLRVGGALCGAMVLATYTALVRGPERAILDPHPAEPGQLLTYLLIRTGLETLPWLLGGVALLTPMLVAGEVEAWAVTAAMAAGGWWLGLLGGFPVHLASVWAAESPGLSGILELLRGQNPRLQAALIYGPGVAFAYGMGALTLASQGGVFLLVPVVAGLVAWIPAPALARGFHVRTTLVLHEIDAAYAFEDEAEEARVVYFEWLLRWLPAGWRTAALKELRHGWRGLRSWLTGAWGLGCLALLAAWSEDPSAVARTALVAGAMLALLAVSGLRLAATDPAWLKVALPMQNLTPARAAVVFAWLQPAILPAFFALLVRQGTVAFRLLLALEVLALALAVMASVCSRWSMKGLAPYLVAAVSLWVAVVRLA